MGHAHRSIVAAGAVLALAAAACGSDPGAAGDPDQALRTALDAAAEWDGTTVTLRLDVAEDDLPLLAVISGEDEATTRYLTASSATISAHPGADPTDASDDVLTFAVDIDGIDAFEVRSIRGEIYLRADVRALVAEFDPDGDVDAKLAEIAAGARGFGVDFLADVFDGTWVHLAGSQRLAAMYGGMMGGPGSGKLPPALASELSAASERLLDDLAVAYVGADAAGDHLRATTTGQQLIDAFTPLLESSADLLPDVLGGASLLDEARADPAFARFAATTIPLEVWVSDGQLSQVGLDLVELARLNPDHPWIDQDEAMVAELDRFLIAAGLARFDGRVDVPEDVIEVDVFDLVGRAMSGAFRFDPPLT